MSDKFEYIEVRHADDGACRWFFVWDRQLEVWMGQGSVETVRAIFYDPDCILCGGQEGVGRCGGWCGAPIPGNKGR